MSTKTLTTAVLGSPVPPLTPHAISVCLPTWKDNIDYGEGDKRVVDSLVTGYPRFFIHRSIKKLASICEQKFGVSGEQCLLFPTSTVAKHCRAFIIQQAAKDNVHFQVRITQLLLHSDSKDRGNCTPSSKLGTELHIVLFPADKFQYAKLFWGHTGTGISSRYAEYFLSLLPEETAPASPAIYTKPRSAHRYYSVREKRQSPATTPCDALSDDHSTYFEERYGRNLSHDAATFAKRALRRRIAGVLLHDGPAVQDSVGSANSELQPSKRGPGVTEDDVYLFPSGMAAIWNAHQTVSAVRPAAKSVGFGWLYVDSLKILAKWGPGYHFFGFGNEEDIDALEALLEAESEKNPGCSPIMCLIAEFPSNPLLRSPNIRRLRDLADKYEFPIIIDDTVGNFLNVEVMPYADIVVSSLTKVFSGDANVMGGSLVVNPQGRYYRALKDQLSSAYEDIYYGEDAIYLERNSRDFERRVRVIDENAEAVCDFLQSRSRAGGAIKHVFYPKWTTRENYEQCRKRGSDGISTGGFGGLLSLTFHSEAASRAFFDSLPINKGPSLGTNFSLACPYAVMAHFTELKWAAGYGVELGLVRISVGMESKEDLLGRLKIATEAAEAAV
ncbi:PLP-dependent transferase [Thelephora ganbajun]|uniref:PLP-dependent transferase n=1 Tax=Thelephora ganbajun TaxID=370292 RepID=A0ACB6ZFW4_THEGA|nr:PLP-dependent transferase [Thelephora ganbajun]